ncbi:acetyl-CoA C-acyltransferase [Microbacterium indicum]|uniref:acetyl-CoA C-acyltransferase n=1 Tax=Microbacterium indicum TaxID=358100 RepID=UPI0003FED52C|nr:acetyl-CoA C-acyltransferase [Microbacterium indicum]
MSAAHPEVVVVAASRTPQGRIGGALASLSAVDLGAAAIRGALAQGGVSASAVDAVLAGNVLQAGSGQNPARQAAIAAGIGWSAPAATVNAVCLSGTAAIIDAARRIRLGEAEVVVAAGMESMSRAPHLLPGSRAGWRYGDAVAVDHAAHDGLTDAFGHESMGALVERDNAALGITREEQDAIALRSHRLAARAAEDGVFDAEITPVDAPRHGTVTGDEGIRPDASAKRLAGLRPAFATGGSITAGNASQLSDGAAAVVLTTRDRAESEGWTVLAALGAHAQIAGPDTALHDRPARAVEAACVREGITPGDLDLLEINEAFAAVVARSQALLGVDPDDVNVHGGGIALGHPIGASGVRLVVHLAHELARRGGGIGAAALCGGGGQGDAVLLRR